MSNDTTSQTQPKQTTLPEDLSANAKPRSDSAKWRVGNLLQALAPKKKTTPEQSSAIQDGSVRPVIGPDKAALFLDSAGKIVSAQPRCAGFFGRQPEELSDLNLKDLLKPGFDQEVSNVLAKGQQASEESFHVLALRKDGSEFATQLAFKFLPGNFGFCWTVFVQAPPGYTDQKSLNGQNGSETRPASELRPMVATTETATQGETPKPEPKEKPPARAALQSRAAQSDAARTEGTRIARIKFEADKRLRQIQKDYGNRLIQLEQDLSAERQLSEDLSKKLEALQNPSAEPQTKPKTAELAIKLEQTSNELRTLRTRAEENEAARKQLTADLEKEREANKLSQKKAEELSTQVQKLQGVAVQAAAPARESAAQSKESEKKAAELKTTADELTRPDAQSAQRVKELEQQLKGANANLSAAKTEAKDWEKKAAEFKKSVEELNRSHTAGQSAEAQSALRVKEFEQELKEASASLATAKTEAEKQNSTRQLLETENRHLTEANAKTKADLDKEREANKLSRKKEQELNAQLQKLQAAAEQAEARVRESAGLSKDWEKKVTEFKKNFDELSRSHADEKNAAALSAQRIKELERQLKDANANFAVGKMDAEKQNSARQRLEAENRNLTEANAGTKADLDKEREANKLSRKKEEELNAQVQKLQKAAEHADARGRESAALSKDWEKKAADFKKNVDELTRSHTAEKNAAAQSAQRLKELEQQLKRADDDLAGSKAENEKRKRLEAEYRNLTEVNARVRAELSESTEKQAVLEKKAGELEQRARQGVFSLAKANAELESHRVERERAEKSAASAAAQLEKLKEKFKRQAESERASQDKIAELEKTIADRGDDLARASAALRKEAKEREVAQKQSRLVSEMGTRLESNLASLEDAKKTFAISMNQKDEQLQSVERSLAETNSSLEKESAERRRLEGLLADAKLQLENVSAESKVEISRLQAALDLGELQRKQLEGDLLRSRGSKKMRSSEENG